MSAVYQLTELTGSPPALLPGSGERPSDEWWRRRNEILRAWLQQVGNLPDPVPPQVDRKGFRAMEGVVAHHLSFTSPDGPPVPAYLLVPDPLPAEPAPGVLALHQTTPLGKDEVCGLGGDPEMHYGLELARRGYVVLAPDCITMGERVRDGSAPVDTADYYRGQTLSAVGRMLVDHRQALTALAMSSPVRLGDIGVIGHSLGGYNAYFLAGIDSRVAATVCSCGFGMFGGDPTPQRWSRESGFDHLPALRESMRAGTVPWEWHEVLALVAPRPLHVWWDEDDEVFPNATEVRAGLDEVGALYHALAADRWFEVEGGSVGHHFPREARERSYDFLDRVLRPSGSTRKADEA